MEQNIQQNEGKPSLQELSLYKSSAGLITRGRKYGYRLYKEKTPDLTHMMIDHAVVPKLKPKYAKTGKYLQPVKLTVPGNRVGPDELLTLGWDFNPTELGYLTREEVKKETGEELPDSELLRSLHYYVSDRVSKAELRYKGRLLNRARFYRTMDESALLAIGKTVESFIEQLVDEKDTWKEYMESVEEEEEPVKEESDESTGTETGSESGSESTYSSDSRSASGSYSSSGSYSQ